MLMTIEEFAKSRNVHPRTVVRLYRAGRLPAEDLGTGKHLELRIDPEVAAAALAGVRSQPHPLSADKAQPRPRARRRPAQPGAARPIHRFV
jgi:excisionase family DNA binding protein